MTAFAFSPVRKLMKQCGAKIVSRDAVELLIEDLTNTSISLTKKVVSLAKHRKRKTINKEDMLLAIKYFE